MKTTFNQPTTVAKRALSNIIPKLYSRLNLWRMLRTAFYLSLALFVLGSGSWIVNTFAPQGLQLFTICILSGVVIGLLLSKIIQ